MPSKADKLPETALRQIAAWIDNGAPYDRPLVEGKAVSPKDRGAITDRDRQWWAFQPLRRTDPPTAKTAGGALNPIDPFVLTRLEAQNLTLNPPADPRTLLRRASFDLRGLPPTPDELEDFAGDTSPDAWANYGTASWATVCTLPAPLVRCIAPA